MWTDAQKTAIEKKGKNILVSAAAGSGKTAVLTQRITDMIVSGETSADRLVVVTFTKAAAAEMRERIRKGLESRYRQDPSNKALFVQMTLLSDADICTIDSFCNKIVKTHFEEAGIDPDYRIPEDAELALLKSDVFSNVIEEFYKEGDEDFFEFVSSFSSAKNDSDIEQIVNSVYEESLNKPWPEEWLDSCVRSACNTDREDALLLEQHKRHIRKRLEEYISGTLTAAQKIYEGSGLEKYKPFLEQEISQIKAASECDCLYELYRSLRTVTFDRIPAAAKGCDEELKALCKGFRDSYKKYITGLTGNAKEPTAESEDDYYLGGRICKKDAEYIMSMTTLLVRITKDFAKALDEEKKKRNIATFADIEHMALDILVEREGGQSRLSAAANELKGFYDAILTDEYQDSNELQETILNAVATDNNRYMVGDVKQSIYGFRGGDPHIFTGKYDEFCAAGSNGELIILQNNFRSRAGVLEGCNKIFSCIMNKEYTGISYDESERLVPSYEFEEYEKPELTFAKENGRISCEVILCGKDEMRDRAHLEALSIADTIKTLFNKGQKVYDTKKKAYRDLCYKDIVILCRKLSTAEIMAETLNSVDIPAYAESRSSYTDTYEIRPVISFLRVIDNPLDDVAFASLMLSFFGGFNAEELALLRAGNKDEFLYKGLIKLCTDDSYTDENVSDKLKNKARAFIEKIHEKREESSHLSVYDLLWQIIYETGYYAYIGSMPSSKRRLANTDLLLNRAFKYTGTGYNGLFQFLRYVEKLEQTDMIRGEISAVSELQDVVRIMTIHKSKGLEFPVVFVAGTGRLMNLREATDLEKIIISGDSIVTDVYDNSRRVKRITAYKKAAQAQIKAEAISEEIRLLYVAMTRASEKLYLVGSTGSDSIQKAAGDACYFKAGNNFGFCDLEAATNYMKLFLPVILKECEAGSGLFDVKETDSAEIIEPDSGNGAVLETDLTEPADYSSDKNEELINRYKDFVYPYQGEINLKPKLTVTELKRLSYADEAEAALDYREAWQEDDEDYTSFSDYNELSVTNAAGRGTLYHKLLEHLDFNKSLEREAVSEQIDALIVKGILAPEAKKMIKPEDIVKLAASDTGRRIAAAFESGKCKREQQFMIGTHIENRYDELLVQGVIDLWLEEADGLVVIDYKTDRVSKRDGEDILKKRYEKQLSVYSDALTQATGKPVKECLIYSFALEKAIAI